MRRGVVSRGRRAPLWMWAAAAAALLPALVPFAALGARAAGAGGEALDILTSGRTIDLAVNTALLVAAVTATSALLGIGAAWVTERTALPFRSVWRVAVALPLVIPSYVIALTLISAVGPGGLLEDAFGIAGPRIRGFTGAWLALTIATYPFVYLMAAAGLRRLDPSREEAARSLGAGRWRVARTVVLPHLQPSVAGGLLLTALYVLSDFGAVSLMRFDALTRSVYAQYAGRLDRVPAAVLAVVLVAAALVILVVESRTRGAAPLHPRRPSRPPHPVRLSLPGRIATIGSLSGLVAVSLGVPLATLVSWVTLRPVSISWGPVAGSLAAASLAALVATILALPVARLTVRHPSRASRWAERSAYAVFALPHLAVALGVVFFASRYLGGLYQSLALLVLVYASLFFAQALGATRAGLLQVDPALEDASRSLGMGRLATAMRITLPLVRPGALAGAALVFLTTMKELPATLLLRPTGFDTLAVRIWSAADELRYAAAAAPALLLVAVSAVPLYLLTTRDA